jgi:hypothetical protein
MTVALLRSLPIIPKLEIEYFAEERPFIPIFYEMCANWILANVIPFFGVRIITTQNVIKENLFANAVMTGPAIE